MAKKATKKKLVKKSSTSKKAATKKASNKKHSVKKATSKKVATKKVASPKKAKAKRAAVKSLSKKTAKSSKVMVSSQTEPQANTLSQVDLTKLELPMTGGGVFKLGDLAAKSIVLYFYPKDATPGCTIEGHDFSKLLPEFKAQNALVFGISRDSLDSHEKFKAKENYTVDLISDEQESACKLFDVIKEKNMYGKKVMGIERSTFVVDTSGKVLKEWRKVSVEGHAQEVLDFIKSL